MSWVALLVRLRWCGAVEFAPHSRTGRRETSREECLRVRHEAGERIVVGRGADESGPSFMKTQQEFEEAHGSRGPSRPRISVRVSARLVRVRSQIRMHISTMVRPR